MQKSKEEAKSNVAEGHKDLGDRACCGAVAVQQSTVQVEQGSTRPRDTAKRSAMQLHLCCSIRIHEEAEVTPCNQNALAHRHALSQLQPRARSTTGCTIRLPDTGAAAYINKHAHMKPGRIVQNMVVVARMWAGVP